jgi:hypothetical protein
MYVELNSWSFKASRIKIFLFVYLSEVPHIRFTVYIDNVTSMFSKRLKFPENLAPVFNRISRILTNILAIYFYSFLCTVVRKVRLSL